MATAPVHARPAAARPRRLPPPRRSPAQYVDVRTRVGAIDRYGYRPNPTTDD